ncbi:ABC transporter ATP-binding protein [Actinorhabdospora filicis]|uniref:ABC transporter ATP-binding protein n=1 Tax=Actinorhabdospora filicis TaxID=1785913 RepID=A0A9W6STL4_9ACTN|nr:ABC-F family ATP-binding cassette domain-containing protein [Actinorhabdospora filicis]GLZ82098.1 ABC transporter ATP-binding protein [Actinorhabdospora filicis]
MTRVRTAHPTSQLAVAGASKVYGDKLVLDAVSFTVRPGERVAVIGENGSGKSTLLRLLAGSELPDNGEVTVSAAGGVGHLGQTLDLPPGSTVADAVDDALSEIRAMEREMRALEERLAEADEEALTAYGDLLAAFDARGGYEADARVEAATHNLGLSHITRDRLLETLSGGERSRLGLACVLAAAPELLLLDEPTNHLDHASVTWLEDQLRAHRGTIVTVTHDRAFLERVATAILEVDGDTHTVSRYGDGWSGYLTAKAATRRRWEQDYTDWLAEIDRQTTLSERGVDEMSKREKSADRPKTAGHRRSHEAGLAGQVRNAKERLERLRAEPVAKPPEPLRFRASVAGGKGEGLAAELVDVKVADRLFVEHFTLAPGARLLLTGPNGAGKTTLLNVLAGVVRADSGKVRRPRRTVYLQQELPPDRLRRDLLSAFAEGLPGPADEHAETLLSLGLFREEDLRRSTLDLSIGQQRRLEIARLVTRPADLLILDEPTNHLSLTLIEELQQALSDYKGALLVVSHDRRFQREFTGDHAELRDGRLLAP